MKQPCAKDCDKRWGECKKTCKAWKEYEEWYFKDLGERAFNKDINKFLDDQEKKRRKDIVLGKLKRKRSKV